MQDQPLIINDITIGKARRLERKQIPNRNETYGGAYDRWLSEGARRRMAKLDEPPALVLFAAMTFGLRPTETEALDKWLAGLWHWHEYIYKPKHQEKE